MKKILPILFLIGPLNFTIAQQLQPKGEFLVDSLRIGEEIPYALTMTYPLEMEVLFPDSNFNFTPFEYSRKEFFLSKSDSVNIKDSAIYYLSSFEIDPVQSLSLPVFLITSGDSTEIPSLPDSVYFAEMVPVLPDSIALREDVNYVNVNQAFNYPYLAIGIAILIVLSIVLYFAFGKQIKKRIYLYRLRKSYEKFSLDFDQVFADLRKHGEKLKTEKLLVLWKKYMEKLEDRPYTKLTSKEIAHLNDASDFAIALKSIDRGIYGHSQWERVFKNFEVLEDITSERYNKKVMEVKNG